MEQYDGQVSTYCAVVHPPDRWLTFQTKKLTHNGNFCLCIVDVDHFVFEQAYGATDGRTDGHAIRSLYCSLLGRSRRTIMVPTALQNSFSLTFQDKLNRFPWLICSRREIPMLVFNRLQSH